MLHYDSQGTGPLVVLLHGFPEYRVTWKKQLPALAAAGFRAVAPDLRGYGLSPKPKGVDAYRIPLIAEDVAELITSLGDGPCILVGHDWGATTAWLLTMMHPELVRKLVIINVTHPAAFARELNRSLEQKIRASYQMFFRLPILPELWMQTFGGFVFRRIGHYTREESADYRRAWRGSLTPMLNYYRAVFRGRSEIRRLMRTIDAPVLLIWGEREPVFIRASTEGLTPYVPNLRFELLPGIGHYAQHDAPERVSELIIEFARDAEG